MESSTVLMAFGLTLLAGLATSIGGALVFFSKKPNAKVLSLALGFSAGVMIYVSFVEIFFEAKNHLTTELGDHLGYWILIITFIGSLLISAGIDRLVPATENPHELDNIEEINGDHPCRKHLFKIGIFTAVAIAIHNFPEGFATFISTLTDYKLGISIAIAVAIHNIPEGMAISVPIYCATKSKKKAFLYAMLSGLAEPIGALAAYLILASLFNGIAMGIVLASTAGIMIFISLDELLPAAQKYGEHHLSIYGMIAGMAVMAVSLVLFV